MTDKRRRSAWPKVETLEDRVVPAGGTWTPLANTDLQGTTGLMLLLPDGTVMVQGGVLVVPGGNTSKTWEKLTPSSTGSYVDGTWSTLASMSLERLYYTSDVLPNGKVLVLGGEQSGPDNDYNWTNTGEIYDPISNTWSPIANFPQNNFGDDPSEVLPDGNVLLGYLLGPQTYIYDPASNTYAQTGTKLNNDRSDEETWLKLPDQSILSYDIFNRIDNGPPYTAERYIPATGQWMATGNVPVALSGSDVGYEQGPALLLPDGRAFFVGATNATALYDPATDTWTAGPSMPTNMGNDDGPGAILPDGQVIFTADTSLPNVYTPPTVLFDFDPATNTLTQLSTPAALTSQLDESAYYDQMLVLPTGQLLLTTGSNQLWIFTPDTSANPTWQPTISGIVNNAGTFTLSGTQLNGMSEGASYGDDAEMAENYPIVQLTDTAGNVTFARTSNWSSSGVQTGNTPVTAQFTDTASPGAYLLSVSAAGISSNDVLFVQMGSGADDVTLQVDPNDSGDIEVLQGGSTVLGTFALSSFSSIVVAGDSGNDTLTLDTDDGSFIPAGGLTFDGGGGSDTLVGPNTTNSWNISGTNSGTLDSNVSFTNVANLTGGSGADTFTFQPAGMVTGKVDGRAGSDTLDLLAAGAQAVATGSGTIDGHMGNTGGAGTVISGGFDNIDVNTTLPSVSGISPSIGPVGGNTTVTITGSGFSWASAVEFGSNPAAFTIDSDSQITATSPAGTVGMADITVATAAGTSATSSADRFNYLAPLALSPASLSAGTANQSYSVSLGASGGSGNYSFALASGSLPPGLILSGAVLAGVPTTAGSYAFTITATDLTYLGLNGSQPYTLLVNPAGSLTLAPTILPAATSKSSFGPIALNASGGYGTYTFKLAASNKLPEGLTLSSSGVLGGIPAAGPGTYTFTITATDVAHSTLTGSFKYSLKINPAITVSPTTLTVATVGDAFTKQLTATGGSGTGYVFAASGLPSWLTLSGAGLLSGTPTSTAGSPIGLNVTVTDSNSATGSRAYSLTVDPVITISPNALNGSATVGDKFSQQLTAWGGSGSGYTFKATGLPAGVTLSTAGLLSGTPTSPAGSPYSIVVSVTDSQKGTATATYSLKVDPAIVVSPTTLSVATVGDGFSQQLTAMGGSGSGYSFALASGSTLPAGLMLGSGGLLSGNPTTAGKYTFTIVGIDIIGATGSRTYTMTIDPALVIAPSSLPPATIGTKYSQQLTSSGGSGKGYTYKATGLPSWLTLSAAGLLSGTPPANAPAQITFTITVTDSNKGTDSAPYTLTINA
jgi:hypothetical protein